jgi:tRNA threonylcarbamoyladenosine modification (KEOPS) complex  Pcc1 subunit
MKRAVVRTRLPDAERVAAAVRPDNTAELTTRVEDGAVVTTIERETTSGLRATLDDYLVNLGVAETTGTHADRPTTDDTQTDTP